MKYQIKIEGRSYQVQLTRGEREGCWRGSLGENGLAATWDFELDARETQPGVLSLLLDGSSYEIKGETTRERLMVAVGAHRYEAEICDARSLRAGRAVAGDHNGPQKITAPMPGKIVRILAEEGDSVEHGQGIMVIEAMKMQNELKSLKKGVVRKVMVQKGAAANAGDVLAIVE
ncbi:MAG TPA: biotin/lipoyl-containing protein [Terriglobales bacterium]|nr:biotin/lipoyl-containing protein [Terriglobales bacterium]